LGGRSPRPPLELVVAVFLIAAAINSVRTVGIGAAGKEKKRIFLCTRFPPRGEARDVRILGGGVLSKASSRTCCRRFLIAAATNSMRAAGIGAAGKEKKGIFLCVRFPPRGEAGVSHQVYTWCSKGLND
jgi:hypothetical protein